MKGGRKRDHRQSDALMQAEQRPLAGGFVADVEVGGVVGRQGVAFVVVQAVAVGRDARHKDVAVERAVDGADRAFHLRRGGAALPIVNVVEDHLEALAGERGLHGLGIVAVGGEILNPAAQVVLGLAVQDGHGVAGFEQLGHKVAADELRSSDNQAIHAKKMGANSPSAQGD